MVQGYSNHPAASIVSNTTCSYRNARSLCCEVLPEGELQQPLRQSILGINVRVITFRLQEQTLSLNMIACHDGCRGPNRIHAALSGL